MSILCTICARSGSKGLKKKNFLRIFGKTLLDRSINQALKVNKIKKIVVSTDAKLLKKNLNNKIFYLDRPKKLSGDKISKIDVIRHAVKEAEIYFKEKFDTIIDLDVSSPLRNLLDINNCINLFKKKNQNNLITICELRKNPYFNMVEIKNNKIKLSKNLSKPLVRRQDAPEVYEMNASIYIWKKKYLNKSKTVVSNKTIYYKMPYSRSIDIDTKDDLKIVKTFIKKNG